MAEATKIIVTQPVTAVYLYQPSGAEDRSVGVRIFLYKNTMDQMKKISIQRGAWEIPYQAWLGIARSSLGQRLLEERQLLLIANSSNIFEDFASPIGINGSVRIEDIIEKCFDKRPTGLLTKWSSWLQSQDMTKQVKYALYLEKINAKLSAKSSPLDLPSYSSAPLDPGYNNYSQGLGQI